MIKFNLKELLARKEFRDGCAVTMTDAAKAVDISRNTLYRMANSKGEFSTKTEYIDKLCRYFNCTPNDLTTIVPEPEEGEEGQGVEKAQ